MVKKSTATFWSSNVSVGETMAYGSVPLTAQDVGTGASNIPLKSSPLLPTLTVGGKLADTKHDSSISFGHSHDQRH
jgi:hypothetical protein